MNNYSRISHVHNALQIIMWRKMFSFQKCGEKKQKVSMLRLLLIYLHQNLFIINKHLALVLKKNFPYLFLCFLNLFK